MFDGERFYLWKSRMNFFIKVNNFEVWNFVINDLFIPTYCINNKVVKKLDNLWIKEDKRKVELNFKAKYFMMNALRTRE